MNDLILELKKICKSFPGVEALKDVNFDLKRGEVHTLVGENGAGKSTLMKILFGIYKHDSGEIIVNGKPEDISGTKHALQLGIGLVPQEINLIPELSVTQNIFLGHEPSKRPGFVVDKKIMYKKAKELLSLFDFENIYKMKVKHLKLAEKQVVEIVKSLSWDSKIIVMDEPTSALSKEEIENLFEIIKKLKEQEISIIYISHRLEEIFEIGDRVTILKDGQNQGTFNVQKIDKDKIIFKMVGSKKIIYQKYKVKKVDYKKNIKKREKVLEVKDLMLHHFKGKLNFELYKGEILGIAGQAGSGRREIGETLYGCYPPESGKIILGSKNVKLKYPSDALALGIGYVPEDRKKDGIIDILTVKENIVLSSLNRIVILGQIVKNNMKRALSLEYIDKLRIKTPHENIEVQYLSGGNQQKVIIAKQLCARTEIIIFNEPTRGIDIVGKSEIYRMMKDLVKSGTSIIMLSSELPEIMSLSDRIIAMKDKEMVGIYDKGDLTTEKLLNIIIN